VYRVIKYIIIFTLSIIAINAYSSSVSGKIGFLAPLTGKYARFSGKFLKGASIAADMSGKSIIAADNKGQPFYSKYRLKWLLKQGVDEIVGPIFYINAKSIEQLLKKHNIVAVSPSGITGGKNLLSVSITPNIADQMAKFAEQSGIKSIKIIYPGNEKFKAAIADKFYSQVALNKNQSVVLSSFSSRNSSDLLSFVKRSFDIRKIGQNQFSCNLPDLVFLDTSILNGKKLLALFKYYGCMPKIVLVLPFWYDNSVLRFDSSLTRNVVVGSVFYKGRDALSKQFSDRFIKEFGYEPALMEAIGFDMAFYLINHKKVANGGQIRGITTLRPNSNSGNLIFLKIEGHQFVETNSIQDK